MSSTEGVYGVKGFGRVCNVKPWVCEGVVDVWECVGVVSVWGCGGVYVCWNTANAIVGVGEHEAP